MIILKIIGFVMLGIAALLLFAYIFQPSLLTLPYSIVIRFFVKNPPFLDTETYFPQHKLLQDNWKTIKAELDEVLAHEEDIPKFHEVDNIQRYISARDNVPWRTFIIKAYGKWSEANAAKVPKTTALLKKIPQVTTALFSILGGGKHIPPHMGFFKGVLRYHLALTVPADAPCYIIVGGKKYTWIEGEDVVFDDTFTHEVWNESTNRRVVLFCDLNRKKGLPVWVLFFNRKIFNILAQSKRLTKVLKRAEVTRDIQS